MTPHQTDVTESIFARIARGDLAVTPVYETDFVIAFADISPQAPVHVLVIPKTPVRDLADLDAGDGALPGDAELAGRLLLACAEVARHTGIAETGFRVVFNTGADGGQTVPYLHAHVLGGRALTWPPG